MPNRIIRESALISETLAQLSHGAERLFWRLTLVADDHGRFDANPAVVKARCFPLLVDRIRTADVVKFLTELSRECIHLYTVESRQYGYFPNWLKYQRTYGLKSKFPEPPADSGNVPQIPGNSCSYPISENRESRIENRCAVKPANGRAHALAELESLTLTDELQAWASKELNAHIPDDVLQEFKAYWRVQKQLRSDWTATFKNRLRELSARKILKPASVW
jgi:hypothetical protein